MYGKTTFKATRATTVAQINLRYSFEKLNPSTNADMLSLRAIIAVRLKYWLNQRYCKYFVRSSVVRDGSQACLPAPFHADMKPNAAPTSAQA